MSSIGPQLPPSSPKRKRTPEDDPSAADQRPSKTARPTTSNDEIDLEGDSDDGFGPSAPPATKPSIGPALPPQTSTNKEEIDLADSDSDSDDDTGPAPPSAPAPQRRQVGPTLPPFEAPPTSTTTKNDSTANGAAPRRVLGPSLPPADLSTRPTTNPYSNSPDSNDSDDDDDDDYGPALPGTARSAQRSSAASTAYQQQHASLAAASAAQPKRDAWMLTPGAGASASSGPDPTKLKARKFASGRAAGAKSSSDGGGISAIWTETAEEKVKRLADAVLGRGGDKQSQQQSGAAAGPRSSESKAEQEARVRAYTEATRGKSLYEEHQTTRAEGRESSKKRLGRDGEEEDDPSKRAFDKEKDMALGGRITHTQRRELLNKAADFGGRFQKGKYL